MAGAAEFERLRDSMIRKKPERQMRPQSFDLAAEFWSGEGDGCS